MFHSPPAQKPTASGAGAARPRPEPYSIHFPQQKPGTYLEPTTRAREPTKGGSAPRLHAHWSPSVWTPYRASETMEAPVPPKKKKRAEKSHDRQ